MHSSKSNFANTLFAIFSLIATATIGAQEAESVYDQILSYQDGTFRVTFYSYLDTDYTFATEDADTINDCLQVEAIFVTLYDWSRKEDLPDDMPQYKAGWGIMRRGFVNGFSTRDEAVEAIVCVHTLRKKYPGN